MTCTRTPGCAGTPGADGYCDQCGMKALSDTTVLPAASPTPPSAPPSAPQAPTTGPTSGPTSGPTRAVSTPVTSGAGGLVTLDRFEPGDPTTAVLTDPQVAESQRFCANPECEAPVGRTRGDEPGRAEGFCPQCGTPFSFIPRLRRGDVVSTYEIAGCLAHGGLGWVYLARDLNVPDTWRVLKGVLRHGDPQATQNALDELRFLAQVNHPNVVKIINFVEHDGAGYIVMEHVDGISLHELLRRRRAANGGIADPLPVTHAIAYVLDILPALGYLHERGLIYCDFKPDNVMRTATSVKLIDLGGVYRVDDTASPIYGTPGYMAPEVAETGPTVASDIFTIGRTLATLCTAFPGFHGQYRYALPPPAEIPEIAAHDGLHQLLLRATRPDPTERFASADAMADQLHGVLREILALERGQPMPAASTNFTGKVRGQLDAPDWHGLPVPLVDAHDPAASYLATIVATDPRELVEALRAAPEPTLDVDVQLVRALLDSGQAEQAPAVLAAIARKAPRDWRGSWSEGLTALATGSPARALEFFDLVSRHLPGELAPKLALALTLELCGDPMGAASWYDVVSRTDPSFTAAAFGLARCARSAGDLGRAAAAYDRVPDSSSAHVMAQVEKARVVLRDPGRAAPVFDAAMIIEPLPLDPAHRDRLVAEILEAALAVGVPSAPSTGSETGPRATAFGHELSESGVRLGLESTYRRLANVASSTEERIALVDRANTVRPRTLL